MPSYVWHLVRNFNRGVLLGKSRLPHHGHHHCGPRSWKNRFCQRWVWGRPFRPSSATNSLCCVALYFDYYYLDKWLTTSLTTINTNIGVQHDVMRNQNIVSVHCQFGCCLSSSSQLRSYHYQRLVKRLFSSEWWCENWTTATPQSSLTKMNSSQVRWTNSQPAWASSTALMAKGLTTQRKCYSINQKWNTVA